MNDNYLLALMYDFYNYNTLRDQNDDIPYYIKQIDKYSSKKVLVVGAGTGRVAIPLAKYCDVTALDFDKERLTVLNEKCNNIKIVHEDFLKFNSNESYDLIIIPYSTIQFDCDKLKLKQMLLKLKELMNKSTIAIFDMSESFNSKEEKSDEFIFEEFCKEIDDKVSVFYTAKRYDEYIEFIIKYKLKKSQKELIENEKYYYFNSSLIDFLIKETGLEVIAKDSGYCNNNSFRHKHLYHCRRKNERK